MGVKYAKQCGIPGDDLATPVDAVYYSAPLDKQPEKLQEFAWALHGRNLNIIMFRVIPQDDRYREIVGKLHPAICYLPDEKKLWLKKQNPNVEQWANTIDQNTGKKVVWDDEFHFSSGGCWCGPDQLQFRFAREMYMRLLRGFNALHAKGYTIKKIYKIAVIGSRKTDEDTMSEGRYLFFLTNRPLRIGGKSMRSLTVFVIVSLFKTLPSPVSVWNTTWLVSGGVSC
ncbi:hypothetical protein SPFM1_00202 [Salmonella phage SPFM1]|nr:hypothetical protein SPFM1_00202 [Salmonella phage SPFM1]